MTLMWTKEASARWDANRQRLFGPAELAAVGLAAPEPEAPVADEWWRVTDGDDVAGYGWLDSEWGDARITFFVAPGQRSRGVGHFILEHLEAEAAARRLNYIYNVVPETHSARPIALPPGLAEWHAPFLIDVARCHAQTGNPRAAEDALAEAERAAPDEVRHHRLTRDLVGELLPRSSRRAKIRALARRCQVSGRDPAMPDASRTPHGDAGEVRILHWNIHSWRDEAGTLNTGAVIKLISRIHPHAVSLTEVNETWSTPLIVSQVAASCGYTWIFCPSFEFGTGNRQADSAMRCSPASRSPRSSTGSCSARTGPTTAPSPPNPGPPPWPGSRSAARPSGSAAPTSRAATPPTGPQRPESSSR